MTDDTAAFPARLRTLREHLGHDVPTFARLIGSTPRTVRKYEAGPRRIMIGYVLAVSEATGVSIDWLATGRLGRDGPRDDRRPMSMDGRHVPPRLRVVGAALTA